MPEVVQQEICQKSNFCVFKVEPQFKRSSQRRMAGFTALHKHDSVNSLIHKLLALKVLMVVCSFPFHRITKYYLRLISLLSPQSPSYLPMITLSLIPEEKENRQNESCNIDGHFHRRFQRFRWWFWFSKFFSCSELRIRVLITVCGHCDFFVSLSYRWSLYYCYSACWQRIICARVFSDVQSYFLHLVIGLYSGLELWYGWRKQNGFQMYNGLVKFKFFLL